LRSSPSFTHTHIFVFFALFFPTVSLSGQGQEADEVNGIGASATGSFHGRYQREERGGLNG
jgi:hypothetical protein